MKKTIEITLPTENANEAPLYCKHENNLQCQPAYIQLDLRTGKVTADYDSSTGGVELDVWNNILKRYPVRSDLTVGQIAEVIDGIKDTLQHIYENSEISMNDSGSTVGVITTHNAIALDDSLTDPAEVLGTGMESLVITDLAEWLLASNNPDTYIPPLGVNVADYIKNFDLDSYISAENVQDVLVSLWLNDIYSDSNYQIQPNIAQFLLNNDLCPEEWMDEVKGVLNAEIESSSPTAAANDLSL